MAWIKLQIHPEHDKVLALADLTGASPERVFAAAVRWFLWVDAHAENDSITISRRAFRDVTRWKGDGLAEAMLNDRVDWLAETGHGLTPTRWETHMSQGAKVRALAAKRAAKVRTERYESNADGVTHSAPREDKRNTEDDGYAPSSAPTRRKPPVAAEPGWWGKAGAIQFNAIERKWRGITPQDYEHWAAAYPAVDVPGEIRRAGEWCVSSGAKGRKSDYRKFLNGWLSRTQDRGGGGGGGYRGGAGPAGGSAEQRRESRRAVEFAEDDLHALPIAGSPPRDSVADS